MFADVVGCPAEAAADNFAKAWLSRDSRCGRFSGSFFAALAIDGNGRIFHAGLVDRSFAPLTTPNVVGQKKLRASFTVAH